jgi:hypothetical protein
MELRGGLKMIQDHLLKMVKVRAIQEQKVTMIFSVEQVQVHKLFKMQAMKLFLKMLVKQKFWNIYKLKLQQEVQEVLWDLERNSKLLMIIILIQLIHKNLKNVCMILELVSLKPKLKLLGVFSIEMEVEKLHMMNSLDVLEDK